MSTEKLGHYRISEKIGAGGMGEVYRSHDEQLGRDVAIKVLPTESFSDPTARARLLREARSAAALNHPNICTIYEVGETDGQTYIAMELVDGRPLSDLIAQRPLAPDQVIRYGIQLADALSHAHDRSIVHRDFKSGNVMITPEGRAKVLDFGVAKRLNSVEVGDGTTDALITQAGTVVGTIAYMAPEQLRGDRGDGRSDIWALGIVLYEMACATRPFRGRTNYEVVSAILNEAVAPPPPNMPVELKAIIERCLAKEPGERYQRASEVRAALEAIQTGAVAPRIASRTPRSWLVPAMAAVLLLLLVIATRFIPFSIRPRHIQSLAVLPLENLSGDASQEYFADGMTDALITDLGQLRGLQRVIARTSVMRYKGSKAPLSEIARQLNVDALMTGTVVRSGDRVRVTAALVDPGSGEQLWADRYERDVRDVLALQSDVARAFAGAVKLKLTPEDATRLGKVRRINPETYEAYLRGMFHLQKFTPQEIEKGLQDLQHAVETDPSDPYAYTGLALGYTLIGSHSPTPAPDAFSRARAAALKAIELDPNMPEAHAAAAAIELYAGWDWPVAKHGLESAVRLNPSFAQAHRDYAWYLAMEGRQEEAIAEMTRAKEADPLSPMYTAELAWQYWIPGREQKALEEARKAVELGPNDWLCLLTLADIGAYNGFYEEAMTAAQKTSSVGPVGKILIALVLAKSGRRDEAIKIAAELGEKPKPIYGWGLAEVYAVLGNNDEALQWLKFGVDRRFAWMPWIRQNPWYAPLRNDPRFQELVQRMNLPPSVPATPASASRRTL